jgi:hypothetical protein
VSSSATSIGNSYGVKTAQRLPSTTHDARAILVALPCAVVHFLFPHIRVELLIRTILTRHWDDDAWPIVREEFKKAMALRSRLRKAGWCNSWRFAISRFLYWTRWRFG